MSDSLKRDYSFAWGDYNVDGEIEATEDGIEIDLGIIITWEWIDEAREALKRKREDEDESAANWDRHYLSEDQ